MPIYTSTCRARTFDIYIYLAAIAELTYRRVVNNEELEEALYGQVLSLDEVVNLWVMEDP